ncbi:MAG: hypothetical protein ACD_20C00234G0034 [uncultured bacterium]|nr:MAG: hypothetical protein ACD_20C00234G0034 [uncultured bacterium]HBH18763.1 hypothetical protein [Cyanobacteria bacterium UBA9579]
MQCKACGIKNSPNSRYCIKCGSGLIDLNGDYEYCPNCNSPLLYPDKPCPYCTDTQNVMEQIFCEECKINLNKGILFSNVKKLSEFDQVLLELNSSKVFCDKCIQSQKNKATAKLKVLKKRFESYIENIPVLSVESLLNHTIVKYCGIINSQSIVKVETVREFGNDKDIWNNLTNDFEYKMKLGEKANLLSLRKEALKNGANAVVKCDINYAELGGSNYMFLIGMMGTAVVIEEFEILTEYEQKVYNYTLEHRLNLGEMYGKQL